MDGTFYWHDYETFGTDPSRDRPVQFAGVRTDADLNVIGEPLVLYSQPARDVLPHPEACLVTGISPQRALAEGIPEYEFIARIHQELACPGTRLREVCRAIQESIEARGLREAKDPSTTPSAGIISR